jgi:hypothetical protein
MVKKSCFCNRPWRPIVLWDVEDPTFSLDSRLTDGGKVFSLTRRPPFTPQEDSSYSFLLRGWVDSRAIVRLKGLGKLKKIHLIGTRTRDLPVCSIVPQPTTLPRGPNIWTWVILNWNEVRTSCLPQRDSTASPYSDVVTGFNLVLA